MLAKTDKCQNEVQNEKIIPDASRSPRRVIITNSIRKLNIINSQ